MRGVGLGLVVLLSVASLCACHTKINDNEQPHIAEGRRILSTLKPDQSAMAHFAPHLKSVPGVQIQPPELGDADLCNNCQLLATVFVLAASSNATMQALQDFLDKECNSFGLPSGIVKICEAIANGGVSLLEALAKLITHDPYSPFAVCAILDMCTINCCTTPTQPEQIHISTATDHSQMSVTWMTLAPTATSTVQYQSASGGDIINQTGSTHTYTNGGWNGTIHVATLSNLSTDSSYTYRVGDDVGGFSAWFTFRSSPPGLGEFGPREDDENSDADSRTFTWTVIGDMGVANSQQTLSVLSSLAANRSMDMVLHVGDISYADGNQQQWDIFLRNVQPVAATVPYMVIPGNHEIAFNFASFKNRFAMPGTTFNAAEDPNIHNFRSSGLGNMYYSFNYGPVHFVGISSETAIDLPGVDSQGMAFIKADLAAADTPAARAQQPWIVVMQHRPMYCSTDRFDCYLFAWYLRALLESVYVQNHVDLVLCGHVHNYERSYPVIMGNPTQFNYSNPTAPVYIVDGAAGNREGLYTGQISPAPNWSAYYDDADYGYGTMTVNAPTADRLSKDRILGVASETQLRFVFRRDTDSAIKDDFTITKTL